LTDYVLQPEGDQVRDIAGRFLIPVTVDDLAANGLLGDSHPHLCWERSVETLTARKGVISGLAVASDEQIEACILYMKDGGILCLRSFVDDGGARVKQLLLRICAGTTSALRFLKVHPAEMAKESMEALGFRPAGVHRRYAARAAAWE
jgi:hypothetical protein